MLDMFGMFRWVCMFHSLCLAKMQGTREEDATSFCSVVYERSSVIYDNSPGKAKTVEGAKLEK
jgi:hypothetical protein